MPSMVYFQWVQNVNVDVNALLHTLRIIIIMSDTHTPTAIEKYQAFRYDSCEKAQSAQHFHILLAIEFHMFSY